MNPEGCPLIVPAVQLIIHVGLTRSFAKPGSNNIYYTVFTISTRLQCIYMYTVVYSITGFQAPSLT